MKSATSWCVRSTGSLPSALSQVSKAAARAATMWGREASSVLGGSGGSIEAAPAVSLYTASPSLSSINSE